MRLATVAQAAQIDQLTQSEYSLSGEVLMEAAGALAAREIDLTYLPELTKGRVAVICGPGNNGGDALVVARHLHSSGYRDLQVFLAAPQEKRSPLFLKQLQRAEAQGLRLIDGWEHPESWPELNACELLIDGLFGIGFQNRLSEPFQKVIEALNSARAPTVSLDTPSGLDSNTGRVHGAAVKAALTITFGLAKPGFFVGEGPAHVGKLRVLPIGFPHEAMRSVATTHFLFTEKLARRYLPLRRETSNKSDHGHLLVAAGRPGYWGAGVLTSSSAFRMGAGYVTWASSEAPYEALRDIPEVLTAQMDEDRLWQSRISAACIGPGLGSGPQTAKWIERLKELGSVPVVVDADAITACVEHKLFPLPAHWVITPHAGELGRILRVQAQDIDKDRFTAAFEACAETGCHVLLKGYRSVVAHGSRCMIVHAGNAALAKAGTGDVLTGMIGGLLAQGLNTAQAAATAAYLHGRLADEWIRSGHDKSALSASDLRDILPQVVARLRLGGNFF